MITPNSITNEERAGFLRKLDQSDLVVTDWEAEFIASFLNSYRWYMWFTPGRIAACDKMILKYGHEPEIGFDFTPTRPVEFPAVHPNGCQFLVNAADNDRRQKPCNEPATKMRRNGFRYCDVHAEQVQRDLKRIGKIIELFPARLPHATEIKN